VSDMLVFTDNTRWLLKKQRQPAVGSGLFDWVPSMTRTMGTVGSFLAANKDTIKNTAHLIGNIAKAGATTTSAVNSG